MNTRRHVGQRVLGGGTLLVVVVALAGCGGSSKGSAAGQSVDREANLYQINQIEQTFHKAMSKHDVNLMMTLFAPGAVFSLGANSLTGKAQIRHFFATENAAFKPQNHWESDTPSYKIRITMDGDKGTLYFECHFVDVKTGAVAPPVGIDDDVQKIGGRWLIVNTAGATATLQP
jgi:ketosteroid isomerase-like protein